MYLQGRSNRYSKVTTRSRDILYAQITGVNNEELSTSQKIGIRAAISGAAMIITAIPKEYGPIDEFNK